MVYILWAFDLDKPLFRRCSVFKPTSQLPYSPLLGKGPGSHRDWPHWCANTDLLHFGKLPDCLIPECQLEDYEGENKKKEIIIA